MPKLIDCITFFQENFVFDLRYNILKDHVNLMVVCESKYDHRGNPKKLNFDLKKKYNKEKIKYLVLEEPFPINNSPWKNQSIQREFILKNLNFLNDDDYIMFSDPDEIPDPNVLSHFRLNKKYGIFKQKCFNYKLNLYNKYETPWEGTRVCKKKDLKSIDYMRQKIKSKNLRYNLLRFDKEKNIKLFNQGGWHFNNIMSAKEISIKLKTFAHSEFSDEKFANENVINSKIQDRIDLFERGHKYKKIELDKSFPDFIIRNKVRFSDWII